ncbi:cobalamin biosynthesis protein [Hoyosella rhizosphaerae]|uniref:CobE/GbiG C-terminal domain-containing protein n=1 Tax=Hoyosella rhizosphaerae TaxID=1755582 RepID=A0A916U6M2_9ACTN|nr:cobalamin biosynthesis protein [Hoyosella rhizosphaerae]MBN4926282.1 cobalamin biosynthesis protein [Hoyosella rhizosphaerae]GGC60598.1 hypothetical protein GCM10011410_11380 [Hoyosella rhizosphaerae]
MIITAGIGLSSRAGPADVFDMLTTLARAAHVLTFVGVGTLDQRRDNSALIDGVAEFAPIAISGFSASQLGAVSVHAPNSWVLDTVGTPSVAEASAMCAARLYAANANGAAEQARIADVAHRKGVRPTHRVAIDVLVPKTLGRYVTGAVACATWTDRVWTDRVSLADTNYSTAHTTD